MTLVEVRQQPLTPMEILSNAVDGGADVATLEKLLDLQQRWQADEARRAFDAAMSDAKAKMPKITKGREVDYTNDKGKRTNYRYEDLASIAETINPILSEHGLSYRFRTESPPNAPISVTCIISHRLGHSEENTLSAPRDEGAGKNSIQAIGSAVTYLQRYTLKAALGLAASYDDDGRLAGGEPSPAPQPRPQKVLNEATGRMVDPSSPNQQRKNGVWQLFEKTVRGFDDLNDLEEWWADAETIRQIAAQPDHWQVEAREEYEKAQERLADKLKAELDAARR